MATTVYLDDNAAAPLRPAARDAVMAALDLTGNPSSVHRYGRLAHRAIEDARAQVAVLTGATTAGVIFTSSGSEANALALQGAGPRRAIVSAVEHDSVLAPAQRLAACATVPVDGDGIVDLAALDELLGTDASDTIVSVMLANNETGALQPVAAVAKLAHARGALVHCDAIAAAGRVLCDMTALGVDLLSISSAKLGGPLGVGALVLRPGLDIAPLLVGGGQERRRRAGTENLPGIVGFGAAAAEALASMADQGRIATLRDRLEAGVMKLASGSRVFARGVARLANTSCLTMPGVLNETQVMALDLAGVAVSAGAACSSGKVSASHVLRAMGVPEDEAKTAIRVSFGWRSADADVDAFLAAWGALHARVGAADRTTAA
ncbi:MAG TPA: cysteine desulfurase family protein [Alphaproteobacteria bacterium]|jgi:cysteine desulfurase